MTCSPPNNDPYTPSEHLCLHVGLVFNFNYATLMVPSIANDMSH